MYVAGAEHLHREPARHFLARVRAGEVDGCTSAEALQEILYPYSSLQRLELGREVYDLFVQTCPLLLDVTLADTDRGRDLLLAHEAISARDALHAAVMLNHEVDHIPTFDQGFDRVLGITRLDLR